MRKLNNKGITNKNILIIILVVIGVFIAGMVILAIITGISARVTSGIMSESKQQSLDDGVQLIVRKIENEVNIASLSSDPVTKLNNLKTTWADEYAEEYGYQSFSCIPSSGSGQGMCIVKFGKVTSGQFATFTPTQTTYELSNMMDISI